MAYPHYFETHGNGIGFMTTCAHCGLVSFNSKKSDEWNEGQEEKAAEGCPCHPQINAKVGIVQLPETLRQILDEISETHAGEKSDPSEAH